MSKRKSEDDPFDFERNKRQKTGESDQGSEDDSSEFKNNKGQKINKKENNDSKYKGSRFKPKSWQRLELGKSIKRENKSLKVWIPDIVWKGINGTKLKSLYLINEWFIDIHGCVRVVAEIINTRQKEWYTGMKCDFPANWLLARYNEWIITGRNNASKITISNLKYNVKDEGAQKRSDRWAKLVKLNLRPGEYVLILDGTGRNLEALLKVGIPASSIIIIDKDIDTSLYHKLLSIRLQEPFESKWTGELLLRESEGIEGCLLKNVVPHQEKISCAYFDFDCDIPDELTSKLLNNKMPNLRLYGITQTKRGHKNEFPIIGNIINEYGKGKGEVWCKFIQVNKTNENNKTYNKSETIIDLTSDDCIKIHNNTTTVIDLTLND